MKALRIILLVLVVLVGGYAIWMSALDAAYQVERSIVIDAKADQIFETTSDFTTWPEWSPWLEHDPKAKIAYGDISAGPGATYTWESDKIGRGTMSLTEADPGKSITTHLSIDGMGESEGLWTFNATPEGQTEVVWSMNGEFPFMMRFFGLAMEETLGKDFERGLEKLKVLVESNKPTESVYQVQKSTTESISYYGIREEVSFQDLTTEFYSSRYGEILAYLGEETHDNINGAPMAIYEKWDEANQMTTLVIALPVNSEMKGNERVFKSEIPAGEVVKTTHTGSYDSSKDAHVAIDEYSKANGLSIGSAPWEIYVTDPGEEPDSNKWVTEIYYPLMNAQTPVDESTIED